MQKNRGKSIPGIPVVLHAVEGLWIMVHSKLRLRYEMSVLAGHLKYMYIHVVGHFSVHFVQASIDVKLRPTGMRSGDRRVSHRQMPCVL